MTAVSTTFEGADVDGLDHLAQEFQQAAQVCDEVKAACEVIVAASFIFGPFGAAFVSYLKTVVIPWLTKISEALKLMAKVLSFHSQAQRDASSSATSLPSYSTPPNLPPGSTANYPVLPPAVGTGSGAAGGTSPAPVGGGTATGSGGSSVGMPPAIGGSTPVPATPPVTPSSPAPPTTSPTVPGGLGSAGGLSGLSGPSGLGSLPPGVSATPLHPGDAVGYMTVPVEIGTDGTITPLLHTTAPTTAPAIPAGPAPVHHAPPVHAVSQPAHHVTRHHESAALGSSGGGSGGGIGGGAGGGGDQGRPPVTPHVAATPTADTHYVSSTPATIGAHPAAHAPAAAAGGGASHDGLYGGLGQATGIGAGAAALARATLHEARQRADNGLLGAVTLPFDADADSAVRATVLNGELQ